MSVKKLMILFLGITCWFSYSNGVIKGVSWSMNKSEIKKALVDNNLSGEKENELSYKNVQFIDGRISLDQTMDLVNFRFKNNKLHSINGIIRRSRNKDNIMVFTAVMKKCMTNDGSVEMKGTPGNMLNIINEKYYYGCGLSYTQKIMDLFVIYYNPADF